MDQNLSKAEQEAERYGNSPDPDQPAANSVNRQLPEKETTGSMWPQPELLGK